MPNSRLQMLLRGQNLLGYRHYEDGVVDRFVDRSAENGMDVFRVFDALNDVRNLRESSSAEEANPAVGRLRNEISALLERTYAPTFWDDPATAREVLGRVYHIERVLKRLDALAARAERLEEKGRHCLLRIWQEQW